MTPDEKSVTERIIGQFNAFASSLCPWQRISWISGYRLPPIPEDYILELDIAVGEDHGVNGVQAVELLVMEQGAVGQGQDGFVIGAMRAGIGPALVAKAIKTEDVRVMVHGF
jgi:hypothetical protein